jgi:hypothetical protein
MDCEIDSAYECCRSQQWNRRLDGERSSYRQATRNQRKLVAQLLVPGNYECRRRRAGLLAPKFREPQRSFLGSAGSDSLVDLLAEIQNFVLRNH